MSEAHDRASLEAAQTGLSVQLRRIEEAEHEGRHVIDVEMEAAGGGTRIVPAPLADAEEWARAALFEVETELERLGAFRLPAAPTTDD